MMEIFSNDNNNNNNNTNSMMMGLAANDFDNDRITNVQEFNNKTDPCMPEKPQQ